MLEDINPDGFLHSKIYEIYYKLEDKIFRVNFGFADLKNGGALVDCTISITNWWDFEGIHYRGNNVINKFTGNEITELDSIVNFTYDGNVLILEYLCGPDEIYHFKFIKPEISITGEYEPD